MSLAALWKVIWRHRRVVIPVAIISLLACVVLAMTSAPTYRVSSSVVLLNPPNLPEVTEQNPTIPEDYQNPYARFQDLSVMVDILAKVLGNDQIGTEMKAEGLDGTFEIAANRDFYRGPIIDVSAEASSKEQAVENAQIVIDNLDEQLSSLQKAQGTDPSYWIKLNVIEPPEKATRVVSGTLRLLIVALAVAGVLTIASALIADALERRRRRTHGSPTSDDGNDWDDTDDVRTSDAADDDDVAERPTINGTNGHPSKWPAPPIQRAELEVR